MQRSRNAALLLEFSCFLAHWKVLSNIFFIPIPWLEYVVNYYFREIAINCFVPMKNLRVKELIKLVFTDKIIEIPEKYDFSKKKLSCFSTTWENHKKWLVRNGMTFFARHICGVECWCLMCGHELAFHDFYSVALFKSR